MFHSRPARKVRAYRPRLEVLEDRTLLSTYLVDHLADDMVGSGTSGSLRYCLTHVINGDDITFGEGVLGTINLASALPNLTHNISIHGPGADLLAVRGPQADRVLTVAAGAVVSLSGLSLAGSGVPHGPDQGGGLYNAGILTVSACTIAHNVAQSQGGGIYNRGSLSLHDSDVSNNTLVPTFDYYYGYAYPTFGGGIFNDRGGTLTVTNCTITGNLAGSGTYDLSGGGGLFNNGSGVATVQSSTIAANGADYGDGLSNSGTLNLRNSIVAGNGGSGAPDVSGRLTTSGHNLIGNPAGGTGFDATDLLGVDPLLGPLQNNGGPTQTMALLPGSPAIGAGDSSGAPDWDQRGPTYARVASGGIDIGAFEAQSDEPTGFSVTGFASPATAGQAGSFTVTALDAAGNPDPSYTGRVHFTSNDSRAALPDDYTFTPDDQGVHSFQATFGTVGSRNLFLGDTLDRFRYGSERGITVRPGATDHYRLGAAALVVGDSPQQITLSTFDAFGNRATNYRGTVDFTSSDSEAILPADYTFTAADGGSHRFTITLHTAGPQAVTVQDTVNGSLSLDHDVRVTRTLWLVASAGNASVLRYDADTGSFIDSFVPPGAGGLVGPSDPIIGPDGNLYVSDAPSSKVLRYDRNTGAYLGDFVTAGSGGLNGDNGIVFRDGYLYVASAGTHSIKRYDATTGAYLGDFVPPDSGGLHRPHGIIFGPDGNLYVNSADDDSVMRYDGTTGAPLPAPGQTGAIFVPPHSGGLLNNWGQLVFGPDGNLYVSGLGTNTVLRYDGTTGAFLGAFVPAGSGGLLMPEGLAFGPDGNLYVVSRTNSVLRYDGSSGAFLGAFAGPGSPLTTGFYLSYWDLDGDAPGPADHYRLSASAVAVGDSPFQVTLTALDASGRWARGYRGTVHFTSTDPQTTLPADYTFTAADGGNHRFTITPHAAGLQTITVQDTANGSLASTHDVRVTRTVWLAPSFDNSSVLRYDSETGAFIDTFIRPGAGGLDGPINAVIGPDGNLYVTSRNNNRVLRYDRNTGAYLDDFIPAGSGGLTSPQDLVFQGNYLYVSSAFTPGRCVFRFDAVTGAFVDRFVPANSGGLQVPAGLIFGADGNLYLNSADNDSVMRYDGTSGVPLPAPGQTGAVFVAAHSGGLLNNYGKPAFGPDGNLYVGSWGTNNVLRYDRTTGAFLGAFVPAGSGGLNRPEGLAFGPDGDLYVVSQGTNSILRYDGATGAFLGVFSGPGGALTVANYLTYWDLDAESPGPAPAPPPGRSPAHVMLGTPPTALTGYFLPWFEPAHANPWPVAALSSSISGVFPRPALLPALIAPLPRVQPADGPRSIASQRQAQDHLFAAWEPERDWLDALQWGNLPW
jgi:streptogramin lyase